MSVEDSDGVAPTDFFAIGVSFGNSNSSIAYTTGVSKRPSYAQLSCINADSYVQEGKAEVIANEEGGKQLGFSCA